MASPDRVSITVADNGVGIAPGNLTRIFNHGFTTKKDGHGFGLHSGANAAKEMGGTLTARSEGLGKGAELTLELPASASTRKLEGITAGVET
jgi:signal transduction histidine kinase